MERHCKYLSLRIVGNIKERVECNVLEALKKL